MLSAETPMLLKCKAISEHDDSYLIESQMCDKTKFQLTANKHDVIPDAKFERNGIVWLKVVKTGQQFAHAHISLPAPTTLHGKQVRVDVLDLKQNV